jgi:hypothetical protein
MRPIDLFVLKIRRYSDARAGRTGIDGILLAPVAQWIEQQPSNLSVVGSIPTGGASIRKCGRMTTSAFRKASFARTCSKGA